MVKRRNLIKSVLCHICASVVVLQNGLLGESMAQNNSSTHPFGLHESRLLNDIFERRVYDKRVRPVSYPGQAINVTFVLDLYQIINVDGKSQTITLFCWVYEYWNDNRLSWEPDDFGGLDQLSVDHKAVWTPDTTLINNGVDVQCVHAVHIEYEPRVFSFPTPRSSIQMDRAQVESRQNVVVDLLDKSNTSQVLFPCTAQYTVGCLFDVQFFPFDTQNCTLTFASWSYDVTKIDYILPNAQVTFEAYQESDEWDVVSFKMNKVLIDYRCCPRPYAMIFASLVMRRKSLYYIVNLVLPTLIISLIASVGLFSSSGSPAGKEDKVNLGITTLLALSILLLTVSDQIPKGSTSIPLLGWYYLIVMLQQSIETLVAVYISHPKNERRIAVLLYRCKMQAIRWIRWKKNNVKRSKENQPCFYTGYRQKYGSKTSLNDAPLDVTRPAKVCMIFNIVMTISITTVVFVGGLIKANIKKHM